MQSHILPHNLNFCHNMFNVTPTIAKLTIISKKSFLSSIAPSTRSSYWIAWCSLHSTITDTPCSPSMLTLSLHIKGLQR